MADGVLETAGLPWYEISNWSCPGHECRHNQNYWRQGEYLGVGCAAHSHLDGRRFWNIRTPERYMAAVASDDSPVAGEERLDSDQRLFESLELAVRTREGVDAAALPDDGTLAGLVARDAGRAVLTLRGRLLANESCAGSGHRPPPPGTMPSTSALTRSESTVARNRRCLWPTASSAPSWPVCSPRPRCSPPISSTPSGTCAGGSPIATCDLLFQISDTLRGVSAGACCSPKGVRDLVASMWGRDFGERKCGERVRMAGTNGSHEESGAGHGLAPRAAHCAGCSS